MVNVATTDTRVRAKIKMEALLVFAILFLVGLFYDRSRRQSDSQRNLPPRQPAPPPPTGRAPPKPGTHRPSPRVSQNGIKFKETQPRAINKENLEGLNDAFTGAPLDPSLGLYQCCSCKVFYHEESYALLVEVNSSRCVSCSSVTIVSLSESEANRGDRKNFNPNAITIDQVKQYVGRVVTFRGFVYDVKVSRRGADYAVMFENTSWTRGFKLVFFKNAARTIGTSYIQGLKGKTITVRGLVVCDITFGYEMIISQKSMILDS